MGTWRKKLDLVTSFEVDVQLTLIENKCARSEHPILNDSPEKKIVKKANHQFVPALAMVYLTYGST